MKRSNNGIGDIMDKSLEKQTTSVGFENVWNSVTSKSGPRGLRFKKMAASPVIMLLTIIILCTTGFAGNTIFRNVDRTDYPFVDDSRVKGKWESVDFVAKIEDFKPGEKSWKSGLFLTSLVFIKDGKMLASIDNGNLSNTSFSWTKDIILSKQEKTSGEYVIKIIDGSTYLFFQWKSGDYVYRNQTPHYYVLKQVDNVDYSNYQVIRMKEDNVDYTFVNDNAMVGKWESVDFVRTVDSFKPDEKRWLGDLYLTKLEFSINGELKRTFEAKTVTSPSITWTQGLIIDKEFKTASKCEIKNINGSEYMFYEWKSGDYVYRGMTPWYYVLKKVK